MKLNKVLKMCIFQSLFIFKLIAVMKTNKQRCLVNFITMQQLGYTCIVKSQFPYIVNTK
jgi:hypothetical protein